ncbi:MAG: group 1 truncated hemoglobin [Gimesia sp.]|nr:group 1 truncated hemoglobin [Gimesia sp.]
MAENLFERIGGTDTINAAVDAHYVAILADDRVKEYFDGVDMAKLATNQKAFLAREFGGPDNYAGQEMRPSHLQFVSRGLSDSHVDAFIEIILGAFRAQGVDDSLLNEIKGILEGHRKDVLER